MGDAPRSWTIELPDQPYVTPNSRTHWRVRARYARAWRQATAWQARAARIPPLAQARVELTLHAADRRRRDRDNLVSGVLKHLLDGLVDAGVVPDDTPEHVDPAMPRIVPPDSGQPRPRTHRWTVTITEVETDAAAAA